MVFISLTCILLVLTVCSARPSKLYESNDILDILRENGVDIPEVNHINSHVYADPTTATVTTGSPPKPVNVVQPTTPYYNTTTTAPIPYTTTPTPYTTTPTPPTTTPTPPTTTPTPTPYTTTIPPTPTPTPTPRLKLVKKKVITIEDFEAESEL